MTLISLVTLFVAINVVRLDFKIFLLFAGVEAMVLLARGLARLGMERESADDWVSKEGVVVGKVVSMILHLTH
jgi:hypothetical protein